MVAKICLTPEQLVILILLGKEKLVNSPVSPEALKVIGRLDSLPNGGRNNFDKRYISAVTGVVTASPGQARAKQVQEAVRVATQKPRGRSAATDWLNTGKAIEVFGTAVSSLPFEPADSIGEFFQAVGQVTQLVAGFGKELEDVYR